MTITFKIITGINDVSVSLSCPVFVYKLVKKKQLSNIPWKEESFWTEAS